MFGLDLYQQAVSFLAELYVIVARDWLTLRYKTAASQGERSY